VFDWARSFGFGSDGWSDIRPLLPAQDHKRIGEGDTGENMVCGSLQLLVTPVLMARIEQEVLQPAIATLRQRGIDYRGVSTRV